LAPDPRFYSAVIVAGASEAQVEAACPALAAADGLIAVDEADGGTRLFFATAEDRDRALALVQRLWPGADATPAEISDENWAERSQAAITAVRVGAITVAPPWDVPSDPEAGLVLVIQPSMGFGTAHHQSTRLCLRLLQTYDATGRRVLDVGTGSGVLAIAALKRGAATVIAADYDADAILSAAENLDLNQAQAVQLLTLDLADASALAAEPFDLVFANLTGGLLQRFAAQLSALVADGGALITSGYQLDERADVDAAFAAAGRRVAEALVEDDWCGQMYR
jgi:ribosomal protein L11 methyltransferase